MVFFLIFEKLLQANSGEPDQSPRFAASDLVLDCLSMPHKKEARIIWVKQLLFLFSYGLRL